MMAPGGIGDMRRYTVWSYAPAPSPASLVKSPPAYPRSLARYLDVGRTVVPPYGVPGRAAAVSGIFARRSLPAAVGVRADVAGGQPAHGQGAVAVRGHDHDRALAALSRRVRLRRASAGGGRGAAARRLPRPLEARLLPAVRRDDGADAPLPRDTGPGRRRVHERDVEGRHVDGDRPRRACLGRGLVRRARLAHLRSDAGTRHVVGDVHERVGLGRRNPSARHRTVPRRGLVRTDDTEAWRGDPRGDALRRSPVAPDRAARRWSRPCFSVSPC